MYDGDVTDLVVDVDAIVTGNDLILGCAKEAMMSTFLGDEMSTITTTKVWIFLHQLAHFVICDTPYDVWSHVRLFFTFRHLAKSMSHTTFCPLKTCYQQPQRSRHRVKGLTKKKHHVSTPYPVISTIGIPLSACTTKFLRLNKM